MLRLLIANHNALLGNVIPMDKEGMRITLHIMLLFHGFKLQSLLTCSQMTGLSRQCTTATSSLSLKKHAAFNGTNPRTTTTLRTEKTKPKFSSMASRSMPAGTRRCTAVTLRDSFLPEIWSLR